MAVFLMKGKFGADYTPPPAQGVFADLSQSDPTAPFAEEAVRELIMGTCGTNLFCPDGIVSRGDMAQFLITAQRSGYGPPPATGIFSDVNLNSPAAKWIEQLYREGITGGCATNPLRYCPADPNTRAQMAVFIDKTFKLQ